MKANDGDAEAQSDLSMRLGVVVEEDLEKHKRARKHYKRVEDLGVRLADAWTALARVSAALGDADEEMRALGLLVDAPEGAVTQTARADALFRLAEVRLGSDEHRDEGVETLSRALARDPRNTAAAEMLREVTDRVSGHAGMLALYERVARAAGDADLLLDVLEKRAAREDATLGEVREGVELATEHERFDRAERLLERAVEIAERSEAGLAGAIWVPLELAARRKAAGDVAGAVRWLETAAGVADEERSFELRIQAATLATHDDSSLDIAAGTLERLLERDPNDRRVWEPLLDVHRRRGAEDRLTDLVNQIVDASLDPATRNVARMQRALFLLAEEGREPDAADALRAILEEDPEHKAAGGMLADLFERTGYDEDLVDLLSRQLDIARDNQDLEQIRDVALKLGGILEKVRREDAMDVYRRALDWLPEDRRLAQALLALLGPEDDPRERIEVLERLLATETGAGAAKLSLELAAEWERLDEPDGMQRALELGYRGCPEDDAIRERLEAWYRERDLWEPLARFMRSEATRIADPRGSLPLFRDAAALYRDTLGDPRAVATTLAEARDIAPDDIQLLAELLEARGAAGETELALAEVGEALESGAGGRDGRVTLLRTRASILTARDDTDAAIADLEEAYQLAGPDVGSDLVEALRERRVEAARTGDMDTERGASLRLVAVLGELGATEEARDILAGWVERAPTDVEALRTLRDVDGAIGRFEDLALTLERLVAVESDDEQIDSALRLADAWTRAGDPGRARPGLEHVARVQSHSVVIRDRLRELYEAAGAHHELGQLLLVDADATSSSDERYELLRRAGDMFLRAGDPGAAVGPLEAAVQIRPEDHPALVLLVDCYIAAERYPEAGQLLEQAIAGHTRRRSPELAELQQRMARLAAAAGDPGLQLQWLNAAMDSDKSNGHIAAELAQLAMQLGNHDTALNALRVVTLNKTDGPMSRAMAFLLQARIAHERGEERRALLWARKARSEDPALTEAEEFLRQIGDA